MDTELVLAVLLGMVTGLVLAETAFIRVLCKFLKSHDVDVLSDDWYPVRIKKYPFTLE